VVPPSHAVQPIRPLEGVRVVDFTWAWAGPHCTMLLASLGAEVIRIESAEKPCLNRQIPPYPDDIPGLNRSGSFNQNNQGKFGAVLDLKRPEGLDLAHELVARSDVLVENYAAGVADRLGMGWKDLSAVNPRLVMLSFSGFGQTGPYRDRIAFGSNITM